jgi:hypothetical protein
MLFVLDMIIFLLELLAPAWWNNRTWINTPCVSD